MLNVEPLQSQICEVDQKRVQEVEKEIQEAKKRLKENKNNPVMVQHYVTEKKQLRKKKEQLMAERLLNLKKLQSQPSSIGMYLNQL